MPKKNNYITTILLIIGSLALGLFVVTLFALIWSFLMENALIVLAITGGIITILTFIGILTYRRVKKTLGKAVYRYKG